VTKTPLKTVIVMTAHIALVQHSAAATGGGDG
jgi:hypothetical protein